MSLMTKIKIAFSSFGKAHRFIGKHKLWHFVYLPGIINVLIFYFSFVWVTGEISDWVTELLSGDCSDSSFGFFCDFFQTFSGLLVFFLRWVFYAAFIGVYLFIYKNLILFLYSPVLAYLIEIVDKKHRGIDTPFSLEQFLKDTVRGLILAIRALLMEGLVVLALFVMAFVPVINLVQPVLMWLVSAYFLGVSMMDYTLERKGMNVRESIIYSKKHKSLATGIGSVFQLVFLVPFVGWMIAPTYAAVAAYFAVEELDNQW